MKKLIFSALLSTLSLSSYAALGPEFKFHQRPHSVCAIEFFVTEKKETLEEVCSAVVIGPKLMLTAAHCTPKLPDRPHKIICRNDVQTQIQQSIKNSKVQLDQLRFDDQEHKNDTGLLKLTNEITTPNMQIFSSREKLEALLDKTNRCGLFGFGGFHHQDRAKGHSTSTVINPDQIQFEGDLIRVNGFKKRASGLVEPGDSGGSLACLNPDNERWVHMAQISGRTMQGVSLFAPVYLFKNELNQHKAFDIDPQGEEHRLEWLKNDELLATQHCQKVLERSGAADVKLSDYEECQKQKSDFIRDQFYSGREIKARLRKYSLVKLDQREEMILLNGKRDPERLFKKENPFSTVDHAFNQFTVTSIDGETVTGDLKIFGYSENFGCTENILCDGGDYKNIKLSIEALALPLLK